VSLTVSLDHVPPTVRAVLRASDDLLPAARGILAAERTRMRAAGVLGELVLVGGSSVPGALTRGDVDLHLRVPPDDFVRVVDRLRAMDDVVRPDIWEPTLATFAVAAPLATGLAATPLDSEHDRRFTRTWRLLAADADLLAEHNSLKLTAVALGEVEYERRKSAFFDRVVAAWDDHPAGGPTVP
jgi:hypothetical protein